jgi:molybdate transport system substrate-binding protein
MTEAVTSLIEHFESGHEGVRFIPNFGSSGTLAKQISQGAPADIFVSANPKWMAYLAEKEMIAPSTLRTLARNRMVVIGTLERETDSLASLLHTTRIAIGNPASVPAGIYAKQALDRTGIYRRLVEDKKLVLAKDVRQAMLYAEMGLVDGAVVYRTDALLAQHSRILIEIPAELHDLVNIPVALTPSGRANKSAQDFYAYMVSRSGAEVLAGYGFDPVL